MRWHSERLGRVSSLLLHGCLLGVQAFLGLNAPCYLPTPSPNTPHNHALPRRLTQPAAEAFAARCTSVDRAYVANFGEEVVRSQPVFMLR